MTTAKRAALVFLGVLSALLLPVLIWMAWPFFESFLLAAVIAIVVHPVNEWLTRRTQRPALATLATTTAAVTLLAGLLGLAGFTLTQELRSAYDALNKRSLEEGGWPALVVGAADRIVDAVATRLPIDKDAIRTELIERMKTVSGYLLSHAGDAVSGLTSLLATAFLVTIFLYFLLRYGRGWLARVVALAPIEQASAERIVGAVHDSVVANVNGVFSVAFGQGLLLIVGFWFVGLRSPMLWGLIGGIASIIPILGAPLVWVPVVIAFLLQGAYWKAVVLGVWGGLVVGSLDNIVRPIVVSASQKQHPVLIGLAAIGGTYAFGPLGILVGPLSVSLAAALLEEIREILLNKD